MSNEIIESGKMSRQELLAASGLESVAPKKNTVTLFRLKTNRDLTDDQERTIPVPSYKVTAPDGAVLYAKELKVTPYYFRYQYTKYDELKNKFTSTVLFENFNEEIIDTAGGFRCGRLTKSQKEDAGIATGTEQKAQDGVKCMRVILATVSGKGVTPEGKEEEFVNIPVLIEHTGANYSAFEDYAKVLVNKGLPAMTVPVDFELTKAKKGSNTYYPTKVNFSPSRTVELTEDVYVTAEEFIKYIRGYNKFIEMQWAKHQGAAVKSYIEVDAEIVEDETAAQNEFFNDEVPF